MPFLSCPDHEFRERKVDLCKCNSCDAVFVNPIPSTKQLGQYYSSTYYNKPRLLTNFLQFLRKRKFANLKPGKILDIGCGSGSFLLAMNSIGWACYGTEISKSSHEFLKNVQLSDIKIYNCFLPDASFKANFFDLVTLWHVLEHLQDPPTYLAHVKKIMKKDGLLMIAVPNSASIGFKLWWCNWLQLDVPRHIFHFNPSSLTKLLHKSGFEIISINHYSFEFNPFTFVQSFYNSIGMEFNFLYKLLKHSNQIQGGKFYFNLLLVLLTLPFIVSISIPISYLFSFLGMGDTIDIIAKKVD